MYRGSVRGWMEGGRGVCEAWGEVDSRRSIVHTLVCLELHDAHSEVEAYSCIVCRVMASRGLSRLSSSCNVGMLRVVRCSCLFEAGRKAHFKPILTSNFLRK